VLAFGVLSVPDFGPHVRVRQAAKSDGYDVDDGTLVLVRPDGYIGVISESVVAIRDWLSRWTR
jgi:hypothetical protein